MRYHSDSQYPHVDMTRTEFEGLKVELQPEPLPEFQRLGSIGRYWHTPIFVDGCPDETPWRNVHRYVIGLEEHRFQDFVEQLRRDAEVNERDEEYWDYETDQALMDAEDAEIIDAEIIE